MTLTRRGSGIKGAEGASIYVDDMAPEECAADSTSHVHKDATNKDGSVQRRREDDELTSLSWLQDKNLLKGMKLRGGAGSKEGSERLAQTCEEELDQEELESNQTEQQPPSVASPQSKHHPHHIPYNPKVHTRWKPPYSFSCLIFMSIENSVLKALPVKEIYAWILDHFPYYRTAPLGWKNSVRHNLSLNKCFKKLDKPSSLGKGSLWTVEPKYRLNLVQALMKAPAPSHPYTPSSSNNYRISSSDTEGSGKEDDERLCSNNDEMIDDVDAARAMLALKHGASINNNIGRKDKVLFGSSRNKAGPDHCYTAATLTAYRGVDDPEELRKTVEGADALLNLAGIKTGRTSCITTKRSFTDTDMLQPSTKRLHIS